mmetsp:Transcript_23544/g.28843  ORF Transcript_23544/g.28843 Transcript_23544/m.28843 type:complete len:524 (-) Transcript_23544:78-1649(-)
MSSKSSKKTRNNVSIKPIKKQRNNVINNKRSNTNDNNKENIVKTLKDNINIVTDEDVDMDSTKIEAPNNINTNNDDIKPKRKLKQVTLSGKDVVKKKINGKKKGNINGNKKIKNNSERKGKIKITKAEFDRKKAKWERYRIKKIKQIIRNTRGKKGKKNSLNHHVNSRLKEEFNTIEFIAPYLRDKKYILKNIGQRDVKKLLIEGKEPYRDLETEFDDFSLYVDPVKHYDFNPLRQDAITNLNGKQINKWIDVYKNEISELEFDIFNDIYNKVNKGNNVIEFPYENIDADTNPDSKGNNNSNNIDNTDTKDDESKRNEYELVPQYCVPIRADVREFDFERLAKVQKDISGRLFDVIMMDPPWMLATANPTRGVALGYSQLKDDLITKIPVPKLIENGLLFIWVINNKYRLGLELFRKWGFKIINDIAWVKQTINRRQAHGHGYYLQHAKETCIVGIKGDFKFNDHVNKGICSDVIYAERRGQSQKPTEIYELIERLVPKGFYLEIFGRRNNLRNGWVTVGNEL